MTIVVGEPDVAIDGDAELRHRVHRRLVVEGADDLAAPGEGALRRRLSELLRDEQPLLSAARFEALLDALTHEVAGLGPLEPLLADPTVTEVMVNGPGHAYVERRGDQALTRIRREKVRKMADLYVSKPNLLDFLVLQEIIRASGAL